MAVSEMALPAVSWKEMIFFMPYNKSLTEEIISNPVQVNKEIEAFYRKIYTSKINANMDNHSLEQKFDDFIKDLNIPQLNDEEQSILDKELTINELKEALTSFADNHESPG